MSAISTSECILLAAALQVGRLVLPVAAEMRQLASAGFRARGGTCASSPRNGRQTSRLFEVASEYHRSSSVEGILAVVSNCCHS